MENKNNEYDPMLRLTEGSRLRLRSVRRGKITERSSPVVARVEFNGELIEVAQTLNCYFVEYPTLETPEMFTVQNQAMKRLAELRDSEPAGLTHNERIRVYSVAQGMARRVRSSIAAIQESKAVIPQEIQDRWGFALNEIEEACKEIAAEVTWEDLMRAEELQAKIDTENETVS